MGAFARPDDELKSEVYRDVVLGVMQLHDSDISVSVIDGVVTMSGNVPTRSDARLLEELTVRVEGVVSVEAEDVTWTADESEPSL